MKSCSTHILPPRLPGLCGPSHTAEDTSDHFTESLPVVAHVWCPQCWTLEWFWHPHQRSLWAFALYLTPAAAEPGHRALQERSAMKLLSDNSNDLIAIPTTVMVDLLLALNIAPVVTHFCWLTGASSGTRQVHIYFLSKPCCTRLDSTWLENHDIHLMGYSKQSCSRCSDRVTRQNIFHLYFADEDAAAVDFVILLGGATIQPAELCSVANAWEAPCPASPCNGAMNLPRVTKDMISDPRSAESSTRPIRLVDNLLKMPSN